MPTAKFMTEIWTPNSYGDYQEAPKWAESIALSFFRTANAAQNKLI